MKGLYKLAALVMAVAMCVALDTMPTVAQSDYYEGKTVRIIIGRPPASGADSTVREFIRFWSKYIPGNPTMVASNMSGGGGMKIFNHIYEDAKPDGLTIAFTPYNPIPQLLKQKSLRADFTKMPLVGGLVNPSLTYASTEVVASRDAVTKMEGEPVYGGQRRLHRFDLAGRMTLDMIGAADKYKYAPGFKGSGTVAKALIRGEIKLMTSGNNVYQKFAVPQLVEKGKAIPLWYHPARTLDNKFVDMSLIFGDTPSFPDYYKSVHGKEPEGEMYEVYKWLLAVVNGMSYVALLPPGTPEEHLKTLEVAFGKVVADPEYQESERKRFKFNLPYVDRPTARHFISLLGDTPATTIAFLEKYSQKGLEKK